MLVPSSFLNSSGTTIYPKPRLSQDYPDHQVYPYLLRNLVVTQNSRRIRAASSRQTRSQDQALKYRTPEVVYWETRSLLKREA